MATSLSALLRAQRSNPSSAPAAGSKQASTSFLKKRRPARGSKKLLPTAGLGTSAVKSRSKVKVFWLTRAGRLFFKKVTAYFLFFFFFSSPALAQSYPTDPASAGNCPAAATPKTPGDGPGGNVFATHINAPQPLDLPDNHVATYPDIETLNPDPFPSENIAPEDLAYPSFPFSGSINNPVLSQSGPESTGKPGGC